MIIQQAALAQGLLGKEKTVQLREGEMFPAKVVKMLPNGMAELSTGTTTIVAKLEVPLQSGERYWFRVTSADDGIQLQVVALPMAGSENIGKMAKELLLQLSLPLTKENKAFVEMMMKEKLPLTKELIIKAGEWLAKGTLSEGLQVIKTMIDHSLPMSKDIFQPLMTAYSPASLAALTKELSSRLQQLEQPPAAATAIIKLLKEWQQPLEKHLVQRVAAAVIEQLFSTDKPSAVQTAAFDLVKSWGIVPKTAENIEDALIQIVRQWSKEQSQPGQLPIENRSTPLKEAISQLVQQPADKASLQRVEQLLSAAARSAEKNAVEPLMTEVKSIMEGVKGKAVSDEQLAALFKTAAKVSIQQNQPHEAIHQLASLFNKEAEEVVQLIRNETAALHSSSLSALSKKDVLFQQIILAAENEIHLHFSAKEAHSLIKDTFRLLGVDLESMLNADIGETEVEKMLKPQLLRLLHENIPVHVRESAEQLLGRMTAQSLLSAENGPLQQLVMQVPVNLFGFHTELTLQWSGKKTEDGQLDADYCRVLFYLNLENIKETVIDMQVQNRIIQLHIFNETPGLKEAAAELIPVLKAGIEDKGYQLSSIQFKQPQKAVLQAPLAQAMAAQPYEGVDIRV